jgi:hypothetical protein
LVLALVMAGAGAECAKEPFFEGLDSYTRKVSTDSPEAQKDFNQGLNFLFGFRRIWAKADVQITNYTVERKAGRCKQLANR